MITTGYPKSDNTWITSLASYSFRLNYEDLDTAPGIYPKEPQLRSLPLNLAGEAKPYKTHHINRSDIDAKCVSLFRNLFDDAILEFDYRSDFTPNQSLFSRPIKPGRLYAILANRFKPTFKLHSVLKEAHRVLGSWAAFAGQCLEQKEKFLILRYEDF